MDQTIEAVLNKRQLGDTPRNIKQASEAKNLAEISNDEYNDDRGVSTKLFNETRDAA